MSVYLDVHFWNFWEGEEVLGTATFKVVCRGCGQMRHVKIIHGTTKEELVEIVPNVVRRETSYIIEDREWYKCENCGSSPNAWRYPRWIEP